MRRRSPAGRRRFESDGLDALGVTTDERNLGALSRKLDRGGAADAASGAGQQDERHLGRPYPHRSAQPGRVDGRI
jgi:hypothetical protein